MTWAEVTCCVLAGLGALAVDALINILIVTRYVKRRIKKWMNEE